MARALKLWVGENERMLVIRAGTAPENYCGILRRFIPDLVLLLDAAHMSEKPGVVCWLPLHTAVGISASTHTLPLHILSTYLTNELSCEVALIGVQPESLSIGPKLSPVVRASVKYTVQTLSNVLRDHDVLCKKKDVVNYSCPPDMVNNQEWRSVLDNA